MNRNLKSGLAVVAAGTLFAIGGMSSSLAAQLITGDDIAKNTITADNLAKNSVGRSELQAGVVKDGQDGKDGKNGKNGNDGAQGPAGPAGAKGDTGPAGPAGAKGDTGAVGPVGPAGPVGAPGPAGIQGPAGPSGQEGAFYAVAKYDVGDTNAGAIATVACSSNPLSTAFTAIAGGVQMIGVGGAATPVSSSFPGRMDWSTNTPKPNRLDGWIVQFAGSQDNPPVKVNVWALCVPRTNIPVTTTYTQSG